MMSCVNCVKNSENFFKLNTTGAEASWSNGLVERHHAMLEDNVRKVMDDSRCSLDIAISWATSAKNALGNVYGFSANQLVFGRNINLPSVHHDKLPAQNESCNSAVISKNLVALHKMRQAFVTQESCERLRRALNRQTRSFSDIVYQTGDKVYFKRNDAKEWHGPAKVLGCEKSQHSCQPLTDEIRDTYDNFQGHLGIFRDTFRDILGIFRDTYLYHSTSQLDRGGR